MFGTIVTPNSAKQPTTTKTPRSRAVVSAAAAAAAAVESNRGEKGGGHKSGSGFGILAPHAPRPFPKAKFI